MDTGSWVELNRATYVNLTTLKDQMVDHRETTDANGNPMPLMSFSPALYGFLTIFDGVQLTEFGAYKENSETGVYLMDRILNIPFA